MDWGETFLKHLELNFTELLSNLPPNAPWREYQQTMALAFQETMEESGDIRIVKGSPRDTEWTEWKNTKRLKLFAASTAPISHVFRLT